MKTFLERQHRQRIEGWGASVTDFHRNGCSFRFYGREYSLMRSDNGFMPVRGTVPIWHQPEYPDAALAIIYRSANY